MRKKNTPSPKHQALNSSLTMHVSRNTCTVAQSKYSVMLIMDHVINSKEGKIQKFYFLCEVQDFPPSSNNI